MTTFLNKNQKRSAMRLTKRFTEEEDKKLITLIERYGAKKWNNIACLMETRTAKQCRERWDSHLKPGINKANQKPFTLHEEETIWRSYIKGEKWAKIALKLGNGRTSNDIKNAYNQRLRKSKHNQIRMSIYYVLNIK
ncbi:6305_t:CDS:2 [Cetraspora pellucida]|uniref:6305_t:CDS:1 n=1 Tax=Cetraspora pellucida TaxID=1433469 RepID=A0A9N8ZCD3_9GLOM|nr:6305_t:CDS:2 [Cetraspora pellucida]